MSSVQTAARLAFLEAAYDWKAPQDKWLSALLDAAAAVWGKPRYGFAYVYDASDPANLRFDKPVMFGPSNFDALLARALDTIVQLPAEIIAASYRSVSVGFGRPLGVLGPDIVAEMAKLGTEDVFALNAIDGTGRNCAIGLGVERTSLTAEEVLLYQRLNSHMASAYRCRRRLLELDHSPLDDCDAILHPDGRLLEARGDATGTAEREALHTASQSMEEVRQHRRDDEPTRAWIPRIRTRWTLVDAFTSGGERYIVARENQAVTAGLEVLTERERQVATAAALGKTAKEIAYDLGISSSTVRVLLARARDRLGVRSEEEFQKLPAIRALRGA